MRLYGTCLRGICSQFETDSRSFPRYHYEHGGDMKVWENLRRRHLAERALNIACFAFGQLGDDDHDETFIALYCDVLTGVCAQYEVTPDGYPPYNYLDDVDTQLASLGEDGRNEQMQWEEGRAYHLAESAFLTAQFAHELMSKQLEKDQLNKKLS